MDINKITEKVTLPVAIVISAVVLAGGFYAVQVNKQQSIERQQALNLEQENKEYVAKRKRDCLAIYKTENDKWSNVVEWSYIPEPSYSLPVKSSESEPSALKRLIRPIGVDGDTCEIKYKDSDSYHYKYF